MRTFVVPDLHGNAELGRALLEEAGVPLSKSGRRNEGVRTVQLGDLANCVRESTGDDIDLLGKALEWFDVVLVGNHEYPYFGGPGFAGFHRDPEVATGIARLERAGILQPCERIGETLLTHAGVSDRWCIPSPREANKRIRAAWRTRRDTDPLLTMIGPHRSFTARTDYGGILWSDWLEGRAPWNQIHGHSVRVDGPEFRWTPEGHFALNLDVGGSVGATRLVGVWVEPDGGLPDPLVGDGPFVETRLEVAV